LAPSRPLPMGKAKPKLRASFGVGAALTSFRVSHAPGFGRILLSIFWLLQHGVRKQVAKISKAGEVFMDMLDSPVSDSRLLAGKSTWRAAAGEGHSIWSGSIKLNGLRS
jgi:hypothetical protein